MSAEDAHSDAHTAKIGVELGEFFANYAAAWSAFDTEAVAAFIAVPLMQVDGTTTEFFETGAEIDEMLDREAERWETAGVTLATAHVTQLLALPDDAARADVEWVLSGQDGVELQRFRVRYTLTEDAGRWAIVLADASR